MSLLAFTFAAFALAIAAILCAATIGLHGSSFVIGAYVVGWAGVVGLGEVLSLLDAVGRSGYVVGAGVVLAAAVSVWQFRSRPRPRLRRPGLGDIRAHPQVAVLGSIVVAVMGYQAFLVVATPPSNGDSLVYHLPRVVAWLQQGHAGYFDAATQRATAFPGNAELGILFTIALLGRDTLAALPQLLSELAVLACVYGSGRRLGFSRAAAAFAALLTATLGQVALQSVTEQNDLVTASFVAAAVYFVLGRDRRELPLAGLAVALAVGTKLTGLLALPIIVLTALFVLPRRRLIEFAVAGAIAFLGFGAFWYAENTIRTHHPFGVVPEADPYRQQHVPGAVASTAAQISWRFVDFTGIHPPEHLLNGLSTTGARLFAVAHIDSRPPGAASNPSVFGFGFHPSTKAFEDSSYFGPLGFLLVFPLSAGFLAAWLCRRTIPARGAVAAGLPLFVLAVALTERYNAWLGRFMIVPVVVVMPMVGWLYDRRLHLLTLLAAALGAATLVGTHLENVAKPVGLSGKTAVWDMPRVDAETVNVGPTIRRAAQLVDSTVPPDGTLGAVLGTNDPSYVFYGPALRRRLVVVSTRDALRKATAEGLRWVVVGPGAGLIASAPEWRVQAVPGGWKLLTRSTLGAPTELVTYGPGPN